MGYRQVIIKKSEKLSLKDEQLVIRKDNDDIKIPLEDINFILIEDNTTNITCKLLSKIGEYSICLLVCNDKFEPSSIMYPYNYHFKQLENLNYQLNLDEHSKQILCQQIIKTKITNEIKVLELTEKDEYTINKLIQFKDEVNPGDNTNREGLAAKMYFRSLFGNNFIRFSDDKINSALNYAYTIVKSSIVRTLAIYGLNTFLGVNHKSKVNNFNLAYDLIEPYRAIIDYYVYKIKDELVYPLNFDNRKKLLNVLNYVIIYNNKKVTIEYSIERLVENYTRILKEPNSKIEFPTIYYE